MKMCIYKNLANDIFIHTIVVMLTFTIGMQTIVYHEPWGLFMLNQSQQGNKTSPHKENINKEKRENITMYVQQNC